MYRNHQVFWFWISCWTVLNRKPNLVLLHFHFFFVHLLSSYFLLQVLAYVFHSTYWKIVVIESGVGKQAVLWLLVNLLVVLEHGFLTFTFVTLNHQLSNHAIIPGLDLEEIYTDVIAVTVIQIVKQVVTTYINHSWLLIPDGSHCQRGTKKRP